MTFWASLLRVIEKTTFLRDFIEGLRVWLIKVVCCPRKQLLHGAKAENEFFILQSPIFLWFLRVLAINDLWMKRKGFLSEHN